MSAPSDKTEIINDPNHPGQTIEVQRSNEPAANDPFEAVARKAWEAKAARNEKEQEHQREIIGKSEDGLGKATADVIRRYGPYGLKWKNPDDPSQGWESAPVEEFIRKRQKEAGSEYPIGGEQTHKSGKLPPGYKPLRPGFLNPNQPQ